MKPYSELEMIQPIDYLNPDNFKTMWDGEPENEYSVQQYNAGLKYGNEFDEIHISQRGTWSASNIDNRTNVTGYEGIGYHRCTSQILQGFLDSTARIFVHRKFLEKPVVIKESTKLAIA